MINSNAICLVMIFIKLVTADIIVIVGRSNRIS